MLVARTIAIILSVTVHGALAYALLPKQIRSDSISLNTGDGDDFITVEQGIAIEGLAKLGDAIETLQTQEIAAIDQTATPPKPVEKVEPIEQLNDAITSEASKVEDDIVETEEPPPEIEEEVEPKEQEEPPPEEKVEEQIPELVPLQQPEQVAILSEQSSGEERVAGDAVAYGLYLGKINAQVQRAKINPRARLAGTVLMRFVVDLDGKLISSKVAKTSGSNVLDEAAMAALERAAPFPPIPPEVSQEPMSFTQPFRFTIR